MLLRYGVSSIVACPLQRDAIDDPPVSTRCQTTTRGISSARRRTTSSAVIVAPL